MNQKYFIIAGESSGDLHGSLLMEQMQLMAPQTIFEGIGGKLMLKRGVQSFVDINKMNVMGFVEVLKKYSFFKSIQRHALQIIKKGDFDGIILIDYPGFNLRLAKKIKNLYPNLPIHYYISPQIWAWKEERIKIIKNCVDQMIVIFSFEKDWYAKRGVCSQFVGHPFLDIYKNIDKSAVRLKLGLSNNKRSLTLFPGSRMQEVQNHLPIMLDAIKDRFFDNFEILLGKGRDISNSQLSSFDLSKVTIVKGNPEDALIASNFAWVGSGTSTLQSVVFLSLIHI